MKVVLTLSFLLCYFALLISQEQQGMYFSKKKYEKKSLPKFEVLKDKLPQPIYDTDSSYASCYWKAWKIAFDNIYEPSEENGFVSQYIDAAFSDNIFLWDMSFITMFANYGTPYVPAICGLDNFYAKQHVSGEICREISRRDGRDYKLWVNIENQPLFSRFGIYYGSEIKTPVLYAGREKPIPNPVLTLEGLNHPILSWAELESFKLTADTTRLKMVWEPLIHYYNALNKYLKQGNGLFVTDWAQMDNSPRNVWLINGGTAVDISAEMVLFARNLSTIATILEKETEAESYTIEADNLSKIINEKMWFEKDHFYYDLTLAEEPIIIKTIGGFWPLVAGVATSEKAHFLSKELDDKSTFNRTHRVPTLSANERGFNPRGGYWRGAIWAPTNMMVIRGLERYGYYEQAKDIALNHLENVVNIFKRTDTIWENYAADFIEPGNPAKDDFVGWSGIAPISYFIEYAIGIKANAPEKLIEWTIRSDDRVGVKKFWFGGITVSLVCHKPDKNGSRDIDVFSNGSFTLKVRYNDGEFVKKIPENETITFIINQ